MFTTHQKLRYLDSVWRSTFSEFRDYINGITDKSITIQDALDIIREARCLPKKQIAELFDALRKGMQPESPSLPFKKIKDREKQLLEQLAKYKKGIIDVENAYTKIAIGHFPPLQKGEKAKEVDINERSFYYWIEAAIAPLNDLLQMTMLAN
jgi:hypothetical protein